MTDTPERKCCKNCNDLEYPLRYLRVLDWRSETQNKCKSERMPYEKKACHLMKNMQSDEQHAAR